MATQTIALDVFRFEPDKGDLAGAEPRFQRYEVPYYEHWVVLDALNWIKDNVDGTLSFRWSCRMGVCGSCGMMVGGEPKLTCAAFLRDYLPGPVRVEPLTYFPVERDLIIDLEGFLAKLQKVTPWLVRDEDLPLEEGEYRQSPNQLALYKQYSMCINCMLCYAACPVVGTHEDFIGPAAMALAQRYNLDSRDEGDQKRYDALSSHDGAYECTFVGECTRVCPKHVDPASAIQRAKVTSMKRYFASMILPWGKK